MNTNTPPQMPRGDRVTDRQVVPGEQRSLKVLVVQNDDAERRAIMRAVSAMGHECRTARDGVEAWEMHVREHLDVIISDWHLPRMGGLELCRRVRAARGNSGYTYFVVLTSFHDKDHFIRGMEAGADDCSSKPVDVDELCARLRAASRVHAIYRELAANNASLRRDRQTSFRVARVDALTQVANRLSMDEDLRALWPRVTRYSSRYSLAMCDVDRFKAHNDDLGHLAGDDALRNVAEAIRQQLRAADGVYRYGGDEFVVLLPEQPLASAARAMERVRLAVEQQRIRTGRGEGMLTLSVGVAEFDPRVHLSPEDWIRSADAALYAAKSAGRNRVATEPQGASGL